MSFNGAALGHVLRIEVKNNPLAAEIFQADLLAFLRTQGKVGCLAAFGRDVGLALSQGDSLPETLGALARVKQLGMSRHIGVSNFTVALIDEAVAACPEPLVCDQVEYHPYLDQTKVLEACARQGMAMVAYSPVAKGRIRGDETLSRIGQSHGKTAAQVCLRWLVQQNVAAIPRTSKIERLSENIDIFDFALSDDEMRLIFRMASAKGRLTDFGFAPKWD